MGKEISINIINEGKEIKLKSMTPVLLADICRNLGLSLSFPCGGNGRCGGCRVRFLKGAPVPGSLDERFLSAKELSEGVRLLCRCVVNDDCSISLGDGGGEGKMAVTMSNTAYDRSGSAIPQDNSLKGSSVAGNAPDRDYSALAIALDIGTTTLAGALIGSCDDSRGPCVIGTAGMANSQRRYGADVITRIAAAGDPGARLGLEGLIRDDVGSLIEQLSEMAGNREISVVAVTGNTTMLHFFTGKDTTGLGSYPYTPVSTQAESPDPVAIFGRKLCGELCVMPGISAFVGADIVSGLYALDVASRRETALLADLGTNGELAFWDGERFRVSSTAAGPVFEAGGISCGMASVPGAIAHVTIGGDGSPGFETIGGVSPLGLCGTGVLETVSELVRTGIADPTGLLTDEYFEKGFPVAAEAGIFFTQSDIRQVQLGKAAVLAGMRALLDGAVPDRVYVSGGFGSNIIPDRIKNIRMFPEGFDDKMVLAGNTALEGAIRYAGAHLAGPATRREAERALDEIRERATVVTLARMDDFDAGYIDAMNF